MISPTDTQAEAPIIPDSERKGGCSAMAGSPWLHYGQSINHNDAVKCKTLSAVRGRDVVGRVVQVRIGCGQFGSDLAFLRMADESLETVENEWFERIENPLFPPRDYDAGGLVYTIGGKWPESGFIVADPKQPQTPGSFTMVVTQANKRI